MSPGGLLAVGRLVVVLIVIVLVRLVVVVVVDVVSVQSSPGLMTSRPNQRHLLKLHKEITFPAVHRTKLTNLGPSTWQKF